MIRYISQRVLLIETPENSFKLRLRRNKDFFKFNDFLTILSHSGLIQIFTVNNCKKKPEQRFSFKSGSKSELLETGIVL